MPASTEFLARSAMLRNALREPLLHFVLLGAALFAADHHLNAGKDDPRTIVVEARLDDEASRLFIAARGSPPNEDELKALRQRWIDNEVLYREGIALGVDQGDAALRERVIFKALSVVDASLELPPYDDRTLRDWFDQRRARYEEPQRFDFQEAVVSGDMSETAMRDFVRALNAGTPGDARAGLRVFKARPRATLDLAYGPDFARALEQLPVGSWNAMPTRGGWRAIRLDGISAARPADFEALRGVVLHDWTDATMADQRTAAVRALAAKYRIRHERVAP